MTPAWRYRAGLLMVTGSALAWSTAGLFTRLIHLDVWTLLLWRGLFGGLGVFLVICLMRGRSGLASFTQLGRAGWGFALLGTVAMLCFIASLKLTTVARSSIIYATVPLVSALLAWVIMRERVSRLTVVSSLVTLSGVAVMVGLGSEGHWLGDALAFGMTLCMASLMVIARKHQGVPMLAAACVSAFASSVAVLPFAQLTLPGTDVLLLLLLFGLVNSALGLALFSVGSKMLPAAETALIGALDAPLAPLWVLMAFAEMPSPATWMGGGIVFLAIFSHMAWSTKSAVEVGAAG